MIGLCINYYNKNYGGLLQAYATTKYFENRGLDYEIIRYQKLVTLLYILKSIPRLFNSILLNDKKEKYKKKIGQIRNPEFKHNNETRNKAFEDFCNESFDKMSPIYRGYDDLYLHSSKYNIVLTGSDQLWSPAGLPTDFYNLEFCAPGVKRVSYASSFGVNYIPWYQKKRTKNYLNRMNMISVRENTGRTIINELIGRDVPVVLDPVFLLTKAEWDEIIPCKKVINKRYVFAYFLGDNQKYRKEVEKYATKKNLKIVTLRHLDQFVQEDEEFGDIAPYNISPKDFLNLIRNAECIFTDSFHGTVFSIIYQKQFLTFNRYLDNSKTSKNSRINTLLSNLNIVDRRYNGTVDEIELEIDYNQVNSTLESMRQYAFAYLDKALNQGVE